jgi:hypothetical protein
LFAAFVPESDAQTILTDLHILGTQNRIGNNTNPAALAVSSYATVTFENDAELVIAAGGALRAETGSVVDLFHATIALPDALTLKDARFDGTNTQLLDGASLSLLGGSAFVARPEAASI